MKLSHILKPEYVFHDLDVTSRDELFAEVTRRLATDGALGEGAAVASLLGERESLGTTVVGDGVAIPHCKVPGLKNFVTAVARLPKPIQFGPETAHQADLVVFVFSPREQPAMHLQLLAAIARLLRQPRARSELRAARSGEEMVTRVAKLEAVP